MGKPNLLTQFLAAYLDLLQDYGDGAVSKLISENLAGPNSGSTMS